MEQPSPAPTAQHPGLILALICLPVFIGALDLTIVSAVLPNVILDLQIPFQTGADDASWVVSGYLLAYTVSVAVMGRISDIIGRRRTYFVSLLIFILGSWLVATATFTPTEWMRRIFRLIEGGRPDTAYMSLYALIAGRVIQALGAGAMVPVSMALVGDLYSPRQRATALGVVGAVDTAGWVLGHLYGGVMVQFVTWPVLFWINIPISAAIAFITWKQLGTVAQAHHEGGLNLPGRMAVWTGVGVVTVLSLMEITRAFIPNTFDAFALRLLKLRLLSSAIALILLAAIVLAFIAARRIEGASRPNWIAAILMTLVLVGLNIGLGGGGEPGLTSTLGDEVDPIFTPVAIAMLALAGVALVAYVLYERRAAYPLFSLNNFKDRNVTLTTIINLFVGFCLMVGLVSVPLFVNGLIARTLDEAALLSGILLGTLTIPMALASVPGGLITERVGYRIPTVAGLGLAVVGFYLAHGWTAEVTRLTMGWNMALAGIGLGLTVAPVGTAMINAVGADERGSASALVLIMRLVGMTISTSTMTHYGLRRSAILLERGIAALGPDPDLSLLGPLAADITVIVITEMLLIAAIIASVGLLPALFLRPVDRQLQAG